MALAKDPYEPQFGRPMGTWFRIFAWRPVDTVDRGWRWGRLVWCRRICKYSYLPGGPNFWFQYVVDKG